MIDFTALYKSKLTTPAEGVERALIKRGMQDGGTDRAKALIALAHPQFRDGLTAAARDMHLI